MRKGSTAISSATKVLGRAGGLRGGPARARRLSASQRSRIASLGAKAKNAKYSKRRVEYLK